MRQFAKEPLNRRDRGVGAEAAADLPRVHPLDASHRRLPLTAPPGGGGAALPRPPTPTPTSPGWWRRTCRRPCERLGRLVGVYALETLSHVEIQPGMISLYLEPTGGAGRASVSCPRFRRRRWRRALQPAAGTVAPGSRVKSEYMKRQREPRWEEDRPCHLELQRYRLGRRLREQAHAPWLSGDCGGSGDSDDSSSGARGPAPQGAAPPTPPHPPASPPAEPAAREGPERRARGPGEERGAEAAEAEEARDAEGTDDAGADKAAAAAALPAPPVKDIKEKPEQEIRTGAPGWLGG
ncbi:LOW QUALITY PROTEIN: uncharacterized protein LOC131998704 [Mustela nigripes]|uniref:LOW QUALITY PROTEIN: uncharacterized protein LOC131998704 n=1 Tax=Mustela nigripes TaxID=77151 RepID=UPI002816024D|nr:LOW QUALITY PROTEIN: uncharacterized protein LOC131998704 [Mustela nigripes]